MKFGQLMRTHAPELAITLRYEAWAPLNSNPIYSPEALDFAREALAAQATPRDRRGTVSASSVYSCFRKQQFTFIGMPEKRFPSKTSSILVNGTFMHLRWQMAGLSEGFFSAVEVPVQKNKYRLSGTIDAIAHDGTIVELKSTNSNGFSRVNAFGPLDGHLEQASTYALVTDAPRAALLYENKDTQEYTEKVYSREELKLDYVAKRAQTLWEHIDSTLLFEPLGAAYEGKRPCTGCVFYDNCLKVKTWDDAVEISQGSSWR